MLTGCQASRPSSSCFTKQSSPVYHTKEGTLLLPGGTAHCGEEKGKKKEKEKKQDQKVSTCISTPSKVEAIPLHFTLTLHLFNFLILCLKNNFCHHNFYIMHSSQLVHKVLWEEKQHKTPQK